MSQDIVWKCVGNGTLYVFRNDVLSAQLTNGQFQTVLYQVNIDTIGYRVQPDMGYHVQGVCGFRDTCQVLENDTRMFTGILSGKVTATFEADPYTPPHPPPPSGNGEGMGLLLPAAVLGFVGYYLLKGRKK